MSKNANNMDLSYFMNDTKPENVEYPAPKRFVNEKGNRINLVFRILSEEELREIRNHHRKRKMVTDPKTKKPLIVSGSVVFDETYDAATAIQEMIVESLVYPNLKDTELMEYYGCVDVLKMPVKVFSGANELGYVAEAFNEVHGFVEKDEADEDGDIQTAKN